MRVAQLTDDANLADWGQQHTAPAAALTAEQRASTQLSSSSSPALSSSCSHWPQLRPCSLLATQTLSYISPSSLHSLSSAASTHSAESAVLGLLARLSA